MYIFGPLNPGVEMLLVSTSSAPSKSAVTGLKIVENPI